MSYYTRVEIECVDSEDGVVDVEAILARAKVYIQEQGYHEDVLADLRVALTGAHNDGVGFNRMHCDLIIDLIPFLSREFPQTWFFVRGAGEGLCDVWLREFRGGLITFCRGPWDEADRGPGHWVKTEDWAKVDPMPTEIQELRTSIIKAVAERSRQFRRERNTKYAIVLFCFCLGLFAALGGLIFARGGAENANQRELDASMENLRRQLSNGEVEGGDAIKRLLGVDEGAKADTAQ